MYALIALAVVLIGWALISARAARYSVSSQIALLLAGALIAGGTNPIVEINLNASGMRTLLELTLALVLFCDASELHLPTVRRSGRLPLRLLAIAFPLSVLAGFLAGRVLFPDADVWVMALVAAALATTDAALAAIVLRDHRVPHDLRTGLNVESGLNDGLATPLVLFFLAAVVSTEPGGARAALGDALAELAIAIVAGAAIGALCAWLLRRSRESHAGTARTQRIAYLAIAPLAFEVAHLAHGNGIVAAFAAGMAVRALDLHIPDDRLEFSHDTEMVLSATVWFLFGSIIPQTLNQITWQVVLYALLSLTLVRMLPVALSLIGTGHPRREVLFLGWFGPRGLACVIFTLIALEQLTGASAAVAAATIVTTVLLSVVVHGLSAAPIAARWRP